MSMLLSAGGVELPIAAVGWAVLVLGVLFVAAWVAALYR